MPEPAPVMTATFPENDCMLVSLIMFFAAVFIIADSGAYPLLAIPSAEMRPVNISGHCRLGSLGCQYCGIINQTMTLSSGLMYRSSAVTLTIDSVCDQLFNFAPTAQKLLQSTVIF